MSKPSSDTTLDLLYSLAGGYDPFSGEAFPEDHICHNPKTIRALFEAIDSIKSTSVASTSRASFAKKIARQGLPWTPSEDEKLKASFQHGTDLKTLSVQHERSGGGVASRLVRLGLIKERKDIR